MKWILLVCLLALASGARAEDNKFSPEWVAEMRAAPEFSLRGNNRNAGQSPGERALRALTPLPGSAAVFARVADDKSASSAGQLYALLGLKWTNPNAFVARVGPFLADDTLVTTERFELPVKAVAQEIARFDKASRFAAPAALERKFQLNSGARYPALFSRRELQKPSMLAQYAPIYDLRFHIDLGDF